MRTSEDDPESEQTTELIDLLLLCPACPLYVVGHSLINVLSYQTRVLTPAPKHSRKKLEILPIFSLAPPAGQRISSPPQHPHFSVNTFGLTVPLEIPTGAVIEPSEIC